MIDTRITLAELNARSHNALMENMGIEFIDIKEDALVARMPVDKRTRQPLGLLHGGASAALAETVGSTAAYLSIDRGQFYTVGLEIKCNHIRSISSGYVFGTAKPIHVGKMTHLWQIKIKDEAGNLICFATHTVAVLELDQSMKEKFKDLFFKA